MRKMDLSDRRKSVREPTAAAGGNAARDTAGRLLFIAAVPDEAVHTARVIQSCRA